MYVKRPKINTRVSCLGSSVGDSVCIAPHRSVFDSRCAQLFFLCFFQVFFEVFGTLRLGLVLALTLVLGLPWSLICHIRNYPQLCKQTIRQAPPAQQIAPGKKNFAGISVLYVNVVCLSTVCMMAHSSVYCSTTDLRCYCVHTDNVWSADVMNKNFCRNGIVAAHGVCTDSGKSYNFEVRETSWSHGILTYESRNFSFRVVNSLRRKMYGQFSCSKDSVAQGSVMFLYSKWYGSFSCGDCTVLKNIEEWS